MPNEDDRFGTSLNNSNKREEGAESDDDERN